MATERPVPESVRITGWFAAVLALMLLARAGSQLFIELPHVRAPVSSGVEGLVGGLADLLSDRTVVRILWAAAPLLLSSVGIVAGLSLARGRDWARRTILAFVYLVLFLAAVYLLFALGSVVKGATEYQGRASIVGAAWWFATLLCWLLLPYLGLRWLRSDTMREACRRIQEPSVP